MKRIWGLWGALWGRSWSCRLMSIWRSPRYRTSSLCSSWVVSRSWFRGWRSRLDLCSRMWRGFTLLRLLGVRNCVRRLLVRRKRWKTFNKSWNRLLQLRTRWSKSVKPLIKNSPKLYKRRIPLKTQTSSCQPRWKKARQRYKHWKQQTSNSLQN